MNKFETDLEWNGAKMQKFIDRKGKREFDMYVDRPTDVPIKLTKQKLSAKAAAAKKRRDIAMAKTPARKAKKAQNQRLGQRSDSDIHHMPNGKVKRVSIKNNRGNFGQGTKNE